MAVPARRKSSTRKRKGQTPKNIGFCKRASVTLTKCKECQQIKPLHWICPSCLTYRSVKINKPEKKEPKIVKA